MNDSLIFCFRTLRIDLTGEESVSSTIVRVRNNITAYLGTTYHFKHYTEWYNAVESEHGMMDITIAFSISRRNYALMKLHNDDIVYDSSTVDIFDFDNLPPYMECIIINA